MADKYIYRVVFINQDQVFEVFVRNVYQGEWYGFVVLEDFIFGEKSSIVVDPSEEKLRLEFEDVGRSYVPLHKIVRIDQVKKRGTARIAALGKVEADAYQKISPLHTGDKK